MKVLEKISESFAWNKDHQKLVSYLENKEVDKAITLSKQLFSHYEEVAKFPTIIEAAQQCFSNCFIQNREDKSFHVLAFEKAKNIRDAFFSGENKHFLNIEKILPVLKNFIISNLKKGDFDSIDQAIKVHREFLGTNLDVVSDKDFRRAIVQALFINLTNEERLYKHNIDKIVKAFLWDKEYFLKGAASSAVEFWHDKGRSDRAREINSKYLWNPDSHLDKRKAA